MGHDRNSPGLKVKVKTGRKATSYSLRVQTAVRQSGMKFTTTESFVLRPLLEDRGHITKNHQSVSRYPQADWNRNVFSWRRKVVVDYSSFNSVGSMFHARGAATEKALSPIRRRVRGTTEVAGRRSTQYRSRGYRFRSR